MEGMLSGDVGAGAAPVKPNDPVTEMEVVGSNEKVTERVGHFLLSVS